MLFELILSKGTTSDEAMDEDATVENCEQADSNVDPNIDSGDRMEIDSFASSSALQVIGILNI